MDSEIQIGGGGGGGGVQTWKGRGGGGCPNLKWSWERGSKSAKSPAKSCEESRWLCSFPLRHGNGKCSTLSALFCSLFWGWF